MSFGISGLSKITNAESRSISAENPRGEKGKGGKATSGTGAECARNLGRGWKISPSVVVSAGETFTMAEIEGPGMINHIWITENSQTNRRLIIRMYWDESNTPSVEAPLGDFFASADCQTYAQLTSIPVCVNPKRAFNCYWEMPFKKNCRITIENIDLQDIVVYYQVDYTLTEIPEDAGYFHAQFRRVNPL